MNKKQVLIEAQKTGKIVKVKYKIGSQPNHAREIIPIRVEDDRVFAKCLNSNSEKMFHINKLRLLTDQQYDRHEKWNPNCAFMTDYEAYVMKTEKQKKIFTYITIGIVVLALLIIYLKMRS